jgi:hypothetical protein
LRNLRAAWPGSGVVGRATRCYARRVTAKGLRRDLDSIDGESSASSEAAADAPAAEGGPASRPAEWEVNVEGREIVGMSASEIVLKLRTGELSGQTLAWRDGMEEWTALDALPVFALAAPVSSRPAASESRPKTSEDVTVKRTPQITEIGLQPPAPVEPVIEEPASLESYDPEGATRVRSLPDVPLEEATVIVRDAETLPPPPAPEVEAVAVSARGDDMAEALAVYERPVATLAFPELDAPADEETIISDPPDPVSEPPAPVPAPRVSAAEEPPVPPLPKLPSRALVSTAAAAFLPPAHPPTRSPSGAPRLSSLGPATGSRPSSPSSPSITKKPLVPSTPAGAAEPAPLVEALLSLTNDRERQPAAPPAASPNPTPAKVSSTPPKAPSAKASAKAPSAPPIRVKPEAPVVTVEPAKRAEAAAPRMQRQHTPAETPLARAASERPPAVETPTPVAAAAALPGAAVSPPPAPPIPLPADSEPLNEAPPPPPPPPLPERGSPNLAGLPANATPTIILREDRDADTMITNLRPARSVPLRTAVAGGAVSTLLGSLITGLVVSSMQPDPPKLPPPPATVATVVAAPVPPPAPEPPKPAVVEEAPAAKPAGSDSAIPSVSARELATEKKPKRSAPAWTPPKPKPKLADPEVALPDDPPSDSAPAEKRPSTGSESSDPASDKNKAAWETSPSPGF